MAPADVVPTETVTEPLIRLDPAGASALLRYDMPDPSTYHGRHLIELLLPPGTFASAAPPAGSATPRPPVRRDPPLAPPAPASSNSTVTPASAPASPAPSPRRPLRLARLAPAEVVTQAARGQRLQVYRSLTGQERYRFVPAERASRPRLYLVECYQLSSFPVAVGAGRVVGSLSLLPGEKAKLAVKTFSRRTTDATQASSILDSLTEESSDEFEQSLEEEQSNKSARDEAREYEADVQASATWGWGEAEVSGGAKQTVSTAREELAKSVGKSLSKHVARASQKREVKVDSTQVEHTEEGEERSTEREVQNISLSRVLNLVFRQVHQSYVSALHLVDIRVGFTDGTVESIDEVPLSRLSTLLARVVVPDRRAAVTEQLLAELSAVRDARGTPHALAVRTSDGASVRFASELTSPCLDPATGARVATVPGIVISEQSSTLRTEAVLVDAVLGQGEALDGYAVELQRIEVARKQAEVDRLRAEARRIEVINSLATGGTANVELIRALREPAPSSEPA